MSGLLGVLVLVLAIICGAVAVCLRWDFDRGLLDPLTVFLLMLFLWLLVYGLFGLRDGWSGFSDGTIHGWYFMHDIDPSTLDLSSKDRMFLLTGWAMTGVIGISLLSYKPIRRKLKTSIPVS